MAIPIGAAAPAHCVADYNDVNGRFFAPDKFFVVEVDQRGTGRSQPSVREDFQRMRRYADISIGAMAADFERVRESLGIERRLAFGGSWGSTLGLEYALTYPSRCLGLILRGIFLNTAAEFDAVYARKSFEANPRRLTEFDTFFELATREVARRGEPSLDLNDSERFVRVYEARVLLVLIACVPRARAEATAQQQATGAVRLPRPPRYNQVGGDRDAIWRFYVLENKLIEDASKLLDPLVIREEVFAEAQSVSFFESRLLLRGTFEEPVQVRPSPKAPCSGDEVGPEIFAQQLVAELRHYGVPHTAYFFDAGHSAHSEAMSTRLKRCVDEFASGAQMASECDSIPSPR
ncbi:hypothetical protein AB1Y20_007527 [Prymnesium parvum]|uniref:prolyl aminopeptidase n=1 Tax=Prymnesium parvum TaxID=97485 RepID=A0AB34IV92_PRYPA